MAKESGGSGFPHCLIEKVPEVKIEELMWYRCPSRDLNPVSLMGMESHFLNKLGIEDEKYVRGEATLVFEFMWVF